MGAADQELLAACGSRSFVFAMFLLKELIPFPAAKLRLEPLLCSHVFSSIPPDRLCQVGLSLPLVCHIAFNFIKIKFEVFLMPKI